jgi:hypothetical protein
MHLVFQIMFLLKALLTAKTVLSPRQSINPPGIDVVAASHTHSESALLNSSQSCLGHAHLQLSIVSLLEQSLFGQVRRTNVGDILGTVKIHVAGFLSQSIERPHRFLTLGFKNAPAP